MLRRQIAVGDELARAMDRCFNDDAGWLKMQDAANTWTVETREKLRAQAGILADAFDQLDQLPIPLTYIQRWTRTLV